MSSPPLSITILGAGIAGLAATLALRQQGHHVRILEKSPAAQEAGAALHLGQNCCSILLRLGLNPLTVGANLLTGRAQHRGPTGETEAKVDLAEANKHLTHPRVLIHRMDLYRELMRLALDPAGEGPVPELLLGCETVQLDTENAVVTLSNGRVFHSDIVLGADGNFSFARKHVEPSTSPYPWTKACYRFLVPRQDLLDDAETRDIIGSKGCLTEVADNDRRIIMYPCRDNALMNVAAIVPTEEAKATGAGEDSLLLDSTIEQIDVLMGEIGWNRIGNQATRKTMLKAFDGFFPAARKLLSHAPDVVRVWQLYKMAPLQHWTKGRVALLGDAAHPFTPFLGQGSGMAVEDAASLAQVLNCGTPVEQVPARLELYERIRSERATWIQEQAIKAGMDEDKRPAINGASILGYCHNHDEWEHSAAELQKWLEGNTRTNAV